MVFFWFWAKDSVSLTRACLPISEDSAIVALKEPMAHLETNFVKYFFLAYKLIENLVEAKIIFFYLDSLFIQDLDNVFLGHLLQIFWLKSNKDFNILIFWWRFYFFMSSWFTSQHPALLVVKTWR